MLLLSLRSALASARLPGAMRLGQHALELDLGEAPLGPPARGACARRGGCRPCGCRASPAPCRRVPAHLLHEAREVGTAGDGTAAAPRLRASRLPASTGAQCRRAAAALGRLGTGAIEKAAQHGEAQRRQIGLGLAPTCSAASAAIRRVSVPKSRGFCASCAGQQPPGLGRKPVLPARPRLDLIAEGPLQRHRRQRRAQPRRAWRCP